METPSEWAKRFNQKTGEHAATPNPQPETVDSPAAVAEFPSEPFQCPACGQLLAPACRVCVACKHTIDPAEIGRRQEQEVVLPAAGTVERAEPVRYPWRIFFVVLGVSFLLGLIYSVTIYMGLLNEDQAKLALQGAPLLCGLWVFYDARRRGIPRPLRWAVGTMLVLIIVFPWYLARRNMPQSRVPFVEAEVGPVTRFLLFALLIFFLVSLIYSFVKSPAPATSPTPTMKAGKIARLSNTRLPAFAPDARGPLLGALRSQADTNAPSDAWQT